MRNRILMAGIALTALVPTAANAARCEDHRTGRIAATIGGGAVGALLGTAIAGRGDNTEGAIIGGVVGAVAGNQIAKGSNDCKYAYGWYDKQGRWHATRVRASDARGYYDMNGDWVAGRPTGYYENGRWIAYSGDPETYGYTDANGYYIPASSYGYYDANDTWVSGTASGYYDSRGRWVAGPARGYYDSRGRWIAGENPDRYEGSTWSGMEQPGYWRDGRWVAGRTSGYYDSRGRWVQTGSGDNYANRDDRYNDRDDRYRDRNDRYNDRDDDTGRYNWNNQPTNLEERITWLRDRVERLENRDRLSDAEARYAINELSAIESQHRIYVRSGGRLTIREEANTRTRLDRLSRRVNDQRQQARM